MKNRKLLVLWLMAVFLHGFAQAELSDAQAVRDFLKNILSESSWSEWLEENAPVNGNYCGVENKPERFEAPCLSRADCVCKAHDFAVSLKNHSKADLNYLNEVLGTTFENKKLDTSYELLFQAMTAKLFAARQVGVDVSEGLKAAHELYAKAPQDALRNLETIIDEDEVFRKKIEEINIEQLKYEERKSDKERLDESNSKGMAVSMHPFHFIFGLFYLNYEYKISNTFSLRLGTSVYATGLITDTYLGYGNNNKDFSTFFTMGLKSFVSGEPLKMGLYVEPIFEFGYENVSRVSDPAIRDRDIAFVPAALFGLEKIFLSGFQVDIGAGVGVHVGIPVSEKSFSTVFVVPKIRASLGYAW